MQNEYVTIREAAEYLQVSYFTVYNMIRFGRIPAERKRNVYRIRRDDVETYRAERDEAAKYDKRRAIRD